MMRVNSSSDISEKNVLVIRDRMLMQKYLQNQKVIDRFMNLYHPIATGAATSHCFIELTNADRSKGVIRQDRASQHDVIVYPKALQPNVIYSVKFRYGEKGYSKSGAELMRSGITFKDTVSSQMIFLNLDDFPGSGTDKVKPSASKISKIKEAIYCGHKGTEIIWTESKDDKLLAGYQLYRNGQLIDFIAIGTYYFDMLTGNSPKARYKVVAVDGDGNTSDIQSIR
jgi:hypothetical protein